MSTGARTANVWRKSCSRGRHDAERGASPARRTSRRNVQLTLQYRRRVLVVEVKRAAVAGAGESRSRWRRYPASASSALA